MTRQQRVVITEKDWTRLRAMLEQARGVLQHDQQHLEMLEAELDEAEIVPTERVPADVITMNSRVSIRDLSHQRNMELTLVYPASSDVARNRISVLAPIGTALIGCRKGDVFEWPMPGGPRRIKVLDVPYQPEAAAGEDMEQPLRRAAGGQR